jgi:hypothetical protein
MGLSLATTRLPTSILRPLRVPKRVDVEHILGLDVFVSTAWALSAFSHKRTPVPDAYACGGPPPPADALPPWPCWPLGVMGVRNLIP